MAESISVLLPPDPRDEAFEEHVASYFLTSGYYVERRLVEREQTDSGSEEILELDLIATDYSTTLPILTLVEAKSGDRWGFPEIFKIFGWMHYLQIPQGMFVVRQGHGNSGFYREKSGELGIKLLFVSGEYSLQPDIGSMPEGIYGEIEHQVWRYSCWIERGLMRKLKAKKKSIQNRQCYAAMEDYYNQVTSGIFFTENIVRRLETLYEVFQSHPRLTAKCAHEELGDPFDDEYETVPQQAFRETWYDCRYTDLQISTFIEHRARLAILKSAVDYTLYKQAGDESKTAAEMKWRILGKQMEISRFDLLPSSFRGGLQSLSSNPYFHRYPVFWQAFLWLFGGFILNDYKEQEYLLLSRKSGIPVEEIPNALQAFNALFPTNGGWLIDIPHSNITVMRMFPVPFKGSGVNYRRYLYTDTHNISDLVLTGTHTHRDLIRWNNLGVEVLNRSS